jgi:hypothetical protein
VSARQLRQHHPRERAFAGASLAQQHQPRRLLCGFKRGKAA